MIKEGDLAKLLVSQQYLSAKEVEFAQKNAQQNHRTLLEELQSSGALAKDVLGQALAEHYKIGFVDLAAKGYSRSTVTKIPAETATKYRLVLYELTKQAAKVATDKSKADNTAKALAKMLGVGKVELSYALTEDIDAALLLYKQALEARFIKIIKAEDHIAPEIIEEIITDAVAYHASDVHFEPQSDETVQVRFRIDGLLQEVGRLPFKYYQNILNRIKVQAKLRIDEHFAAQDGSMRFEHEEGYVDLRVSIIPTVEGEKVVIRILARYIKNFTLGELGLSESHQNIILNNIKKPFGMILVVGPTGSGKSTTLYAALRATQKPELNITTIEDPVEYRIEGVNQIQVNTQTDLTFAKGLRSIVRQDPDVILVGEIRDQETAEIAVNAALTGHLLHSTFHANDAATSIPRLLEMDVEPFLVASTLELIIGQRLVRKICDHCRVSFSASKKDLDTQHKVASSMLLSGNQSSVNLYKGKGCEACGHTGFKGRTAIFEMIAVSPALKELILKNPSTAEIWALAKKEGAASLFEDGIDKVKQGVTTIEELLRVAQPT